MSDEWTEADDAIEEVWEIRRQIWARFDNDTEKLMTHYIERDKQRAEQRIDTPPPAEKDKSAA